MLSGGGVARDCIRPAHHEGGRQPPSTVYQREVYIYRLPTGSVDGGEAAREEGGLIDRLPTGSVDGTEGPKASKGPVDRLPTGSVYLQITNGKCRRGQPSPLALTQAHHVLALLPPRPHPSPSCPDTPLQGRHPGRRHIAYGAVGGCGGARGARECVRVYGDCGGRGGDKVAGVGRAGGGSVRVHPPLVHSGPSPHPLSCAQPPPVSEIISQFNVCPDVAV